MWLVGSGNVNRWIIIIYSLNYCFLTIYSLHSSPKPSYKHNIFYPSSQHPPLTPPLTPPFTPTNTPTISFHHPHTQFITPFHRHADLERPVFRTTTTVAFIFSSNLPLPFILPFLPVIEFDLIQFIKLLHLENVGLPQCNIQ